MKNNTSIGAHRATYPEGLMKSIGNASLGVTLGVDAFDFKPVFHLNNDRFRHTVIIGRTGSGKSNHVLQLEREDILSGAGVAIIAAHEEDAIYPLTWVPEDRIDDVVLIDASNGRYQPCMNPLDVDRTDPTAVDKAIANAIALLTTGEPYEWSGTRFKQMAQLGFKLMLHPKFPDPPHIALLERLYTDPDYVSECLDCCGDQNLRDQWRVEARTFRSSDHDERIHWFLSKAKRISGNKMLSHVFGPGKATIDIEEIVRKGQILVAAIPEARIGRDAAQMLRSWIIGRLHDAILSRGHAQSASSGGASDLGLFGEPPDSLSELDPFFVYVDEFSKFADPSFAALLAESRKYHVGFTLSFQTFSQVDAFDTVTGRTSNLLPTIIGNAGSFICYPMGWIDAEIIAQQIGADTNSVRNIERYKPLAWLCMDNQATRARELIVAPKPEPWRTSTPRRIARRHIGYKRWLPLGSTLPQRPGIQPSDARRLG